MEQIMNAYEEIYKYKNLNSEDVKDEVSSLNNNFSIEENHRNLDDELYYKDSTNSKSIDFDTGSAKDCLEFEEDQLEVTSNYENVKMHRQCSTCICAKCQKDIRIETDFYAQFWLKDNKLTLCQNNGNCKKSLFGDILADPDCVPLELSFDFDDSPQLEAECYAKDIDYQLKQINEYVKSVSIDENIQYNDQDIVVDTPALIQSIEDQAGVISDQIGSIDDVILEPRHYIESNSHCEKSQSNSSEHWSQNQADKASEGIVDEFSTNTKGSSDKKTNTLSIRRSCFRKLSAYYKGTFSKFNRAWQEKRRNKKKTRNMNELIDIYMRQEFAGLLINLDEEFLVKLRNALVAILHSHRYKKREEFTEDIDFTVIRDVLYSYTLDARDRFINDPAYALIFHHFFVNGGTEYLNSRVQSKSNIYAFELISLNKDALHTLK